MEIIHITIVSQTTPDITGQTNRSIHHSARNWEESTNLRHQHISLQQLFVKNTLVADITQNIIAVQPILLCQNDTLFVSFLHDVIKRAEILCKSLDFFLCIRLIRNKTSIIDQKHQHTKQRSNIWLCPNYLIKLVQQVVHTIFHNIGHVFIRDIYEMRLLYLQKLILSIVVQNIEPEHFLLVIFLPIYNLFFLISKRTNHTEETVYGSRYITANAQQTRQRTIQISQAFCVDTLSI